MEELQKAKFLPSVYKDIFQLSGSGTLGEDEKDENRLNISNYNIKVDHGSRSTVGKINMMTRELRKMDLYEEYTISGVTEEKMYAKENGEKQKKIMQKIQINEVLGMQKT